MIALLVPDADAAAAQKGIGGLGEGTVAGEQLQAMDCPDRAPV